MPKFTIITVVKNSDETITDTINSILSQKCKDYEYIIIDGCSSDNTVNVINKHSNSKIILVSEPDNGIYDAMNKGIALAKGQIIGFLNADDMYCNSGVLDLVASVMNNDAVDSCYSDLLYVKNTDVNKIVRYWRSSHASKDDFYRGWIPPHPTFFVKKTVYEENGVFRTDLGQAADYELMLRLLLCNSISSSYIPTVLVKMRTGGVTNSSFQSRINNHRSALLAWEVNGIKPMPWTLYLRSLRKFVQYLMPIARHNKAIHQFLLQKPQ